MDKSLYVKSLYLYVIHKLFQKMNELIEMNVAIGGSKTMADKDCLWVQIRQYLLDLIQQNSDIPGYRLPSENQLALRFNASRAAAKHAFDSLEQEHVIVRQRGRGTFIARNLIEQNTSMSSIVDISAERTIALIIPFIATYLLLNPIIQGIQDELSKHKLHLVIYITDDDPQKEASYFYKVQSTCRGVILFAGSYAQYHDALLKLVVNQFPIVLIDRYLPGLNLSYVACDHQRAAYNGVRLLQQQGHRRISMIGPVPDKATAVIERCQGFDEATRELDPDYPNSFHLYGADMLANFEGVFDAHLQKMAPTAIICHVESVVLDVMRFLKARNLENKITLMAFDNIFVTSQEFISYPMYIIDQQPYLIGKTAADLLYRMIFHGNKPETIKLRELIYNIGC